MEINCIEKCKNARFNSKYEWADAEIKWWSIGPKDTHLTNFQNMENK